MIGGSTALLDEVVEGGKFLRAVVDFVSEHILGDSTEGDLVVSI